MAVTLTHIYGREHHVVKKLQTKRMLSAVILCDLLKVNFAPRVFVTMET